jgi:hypothetical protein
VKSCHDFLVSGVRLASGDQQNIQTLITKYETTKIGSKRVMRFNVPIKTRRASQQGAKKAL